MIFTLPNVFAEEIEQTFDITFDELDYKLETEEHKIVPIKFYVHNHDYKIKPEMYIIHHGKTISDYTWPNLNSGNFVTYILIDRNWSSGTYKIVLKYDETYLPDLFAKVEI